MGEHCGGGGWEHADLSAYLISLRGVKYLHLRVGNCYYHVTYLSGVLRSSLEHSQLYGMDTERHSQHSDREHVIHTVSTQTREIGR